MKRRNGFTLIELLAVIVILAIIALIATPIVLNIIKNARESAARSSALGYMDSVESYIQLAESAEDLDIKDDVFKNVTIPKNTTCTKVGGVWNSECAEFFEKVDLKTNGDKPTDAVINFGANSNILDDSKITIKKYELTYKDNDVILEGKKEEIKVNTGATKKLATADDTFKAIVYLDPTNIENECNESLAVSTPGTKTGCMKWYAYYEDSKNYKLILDHNTTRQVTYSYGQGAYSNVGTQLETDTSGWIGNPDIITADEIATITKHPTFNSVTSRQEDYFYLDSNSKTKVANSTNTSKYYWLYDYTVNCVSYGCKVADANSYGYWTKSVVSNNTNNNWHIYGNGNLSTYYNVACSSYNCVSGTAYYFGLRPIITVEKNLIK